MLARCFTPTRARCSARPSTVVCQRRTYYAALLIAAAERIRAIGLVRQRPHGKTTYSTRLALAPPPSSNYTHTHPPILSSKSEMIRFSILTRCLCFLLQVIHPVPAAVPWQLEGELVIASKFGKLRKMKRRCRRVDSFEK